MEALMMESEMSNWNDDRLDELNGRVKDGFASVDQHFIRVEGEMKDGFAKVDKRFERVEGEIKEGFARVDGEIKEGFARVDREMKEGFAQAASRKEIGEVKAQLDRLTDRIDRLYALLIVAMFSVAGAVFANGSLT